MLFAILFAILLSIVEVFLCMKSTRRAWILPIILGLYLVYSYCRVVKYQELTYVDMLPSLIIFVPNIITFIICKIAIKKR